MPYVIETLVTFEGQGQGWSETFYWNSTDGNLASAETLVTPLIQKRSRLLANTYVLTVVRNSVVIDNAGAKVLRQTDLIEPRLPGVASWPPSTPNLALLCVWQTADNKLSKKQYMRGIPAGIGDMGKAYDPNYASFGTSFAAWVSAMQSFGAGWLATSVAKSRNDYRVRSGRRDRTGHVHVGGSRYRPVAGAVRLAERDLRELPGKSPLDGALVVIPVSATSCFTPGSHPAALCPRDRLD